MLKKIIRWITHQKEALVFQATQQGWQLTFNNTVLNTDEAIFDWVATVADDQLGLAFYLTQLVTENIAQYDSKGLIISWDNIYKLLSDENHSDLRGLLQLPTINDSVSPILDCESTISDSSFTLSIRGWQQNNNLIKNSQLIGAVLCTPDHKFLLPHAAWKLTQAMQKFEQRSPEQRSQYYQELAWGKLRPLATRSTASYASRYLEGTIILTPESLQLELEHFNDTVIVKPTFDQAPNEWLQRFDTHQQVQNHYDFSNTEGRSRVILTESVKKVLQFIKHEMPNRQVKSNKAIAFIRNPYALLGEELTQVIDINHFEAEKTKLGTQEKTWHIQADIQQGQIIRVCLFINGIDTVEIFQYPELLDNFLIKLEKSLDQQAISLYWQNHLLDLNHTAESEFQQGQRILAVWQQQQKLTINYDDIYDLSQYGDRVIGIGEIRPIALPILLKNENEASWSPEMEPAILIKISDGNSLIVPATQDFMIQLEKNINDSKNLNNSTITLPYIHQETNLQDATQALDTIKNFLNTPSSATSNNPPIELSKPKQKTLLIQSNFDRLEYIKQRKKKLSLPSHFLVKLPSKLKPNIQLKLHQQEGLRWLQYLTNLKDGCSGALLADDMGLGKTLQLLSLLASFYEAQPESHPSLIVAPVSLLENWEQEIKNFFEDYPPILRLHGDSLKKLKQPKERIDQQLIEEGIFNLLVPHWLDNAKIVITTYETIRNYEFSLARQPFYFIICDEAQKIKNPTSITTLAIKKQKAHFKIACTGTPVENHLIDLWSLFDWIQPSLLGTTQEFHSLYRRPIEAKTDQEKNTLQELRGLIGPQTLRRTKQDISSELPKKALESPVIPMSDYQYKLYQDTVTRLNHTKQERNATQRVKNTWGLLHKIKAICAEPYCLPSQKFEPDKPLDKHLDNSPKLKWLLHKLDKIRIQNEKAIIFTELRQVQIALSFFLKKRFNITPSIINGETENRQYLINRFQQQASFNIIILSPLAAGAGLNIVAANHVIHFTRTWNPAKETQATDRAYRIGQRKDVYVYCPTIIHSDFITFEAKLDQLMQSKQALATDMLNGIGKNFTPFDFNMDSFQTTELSYYLTLLDIDELDGDTFEKLCLILLEKMGWQTTQTAKLQGDGGIDLIAISKTEGLLIQCKRSSKNLGWDAIKEVVAGTARYQKIYPSINFTRLAITNQYFNLNAREQAQYNHVQLWERQNLEKYLNEFQITREELDQLIILT